MKKIAVVILLAFFGLGCKGVSGTAGEAADRKSNKSVQSVSSEGVNQGGSNTQTNQPSGPVLVPARDLEKSSIKKDVPPSK
jgi:hypothetical protein